MRINGPTDDTVDLKTADDVTPTILELAVGCAEGSDYMGNHPGINWEYAYDMLESNEGYFITDMGNGADLKIRREVRKRRKEQ